MATAAAAVADKKLRRDGGQNAFMIRDLRIYCVVTLVNASLTIKEYVRDQVGWSPRRPRHAALPP